MHEGGRPEDCVNILLVGVAAIIAVRVYFDARRRDARPPLAWALAAFATTGLVLPVYLANRPPLPGQVRRGGRKWHVLRNFAALAGFIGAIPVTALSATALLEASPRDLMGALRALQPVVSPAVKWFSPAILLFLFGLGVRQPDIVERDDRPAVDERVDSKAGEANPAMKLPWQPMVVLAAILALGVMFALD
jgi:hypothetical protein